MSHRPPVGATGVVRTPVGERATLFSFGMERDYSATGMSAAEVVLEVSWRVEQPLARVWDQFKDFNRWQNQHGYYWSGAMEDGNVVYMSDKVSSYGARIPYVVRKVIPSQLLYLESLPSPYGGTETAWSGHNIMSFAGGADSTQISIYMEHTWQSRKDSAAKMAEIAKAAVDAATIFWKDSFIPAFEGLFAPGGARRA